MKNPGILIFLFLFPILTLGATPTDSISTTYRDGEFVTYCQVWVRTSDSISHSVTNDFVHQMRYDLDALFGWALKGMNLRREKNDLMVFDFKSTSFNKETGVIRGVGDVIVPNVTSIPNIIVESRLTQRQLSNGKKDIYIDLLSSNVLLKKMFGTFSVIPRKNRGAWYTLETHVRFGWFFNVFITQKRFKTIMEWRLKKFVNNIKVEAERRN